MATRKRSAASLLTGLFLVSGLIGFVLISAVISGAIDRLTPSEPYTVRFPLDRGAPGVKTGSAVTMGGQPVGRVTDVSFAREPDGATVGVDVGISINKEHTLFGDARFVLVRPLVGEGGTLNITSVGSPESGSLAPGSLVPASIGVPSFLADAGYGDTQAAQVQKMIADSAVLIERAEDIATRLDEDLSVITADARSFSQNLRVTSDDVRTRWPEISDEVGTVVDSIAIAGEGVDRAVAETEQLLRDLRAMLDENSPRIRETLEGVQRIVDRVEAEHLGSAMTLLADSSEAAKDLARIADRVDTLLAEQGPSIGRSLANARLASDQLRQASYEIRRNPWRLLTRPDTKELEGELIYDAARSHADAASDLRDAAASLDSILQSDADAGESGAGKELQTQLQEALTRYDTAQTHLLELISSD